MNYNTVRKNNKKNNYKISSKYVLKLLLTIVIVLIVLILIKSSNNFKANFYKYVYEQNISFAKLNKLYEKYIGNALPLENVVNKTEVVFSEKINYTNKENYKDGVKLEVSSNYLIPIQESGIVVYIGEKEGYNNVIIIQQEKGDDMWYGNISNVNVKLYDYVNKGAVLGECNDYLYLLFKKDGNVLNYEDYI